MRCPPQSQAFENLFFDLQFYLEGLADLTLWTQVCQWGRLCKLKKTFPLFFTLKYRNRIDISFLGISKIPIVQELRVMTSKLYIVKLTPLGQCVDQSPEYLYTSQVVWSFQQPFVNRYNLTIVTSSLPEYFWVLGILIQ